MFITYSKDSSLRIKFIAPFLISILFIIGGINVISLNNLYQYEEKNRINTVKYIQKAIYNNVFPPLPEIIEYIFLLDEDNHIQIIYDKDKVLINNFINDLTNNNLLINIKPLSSPDNISSDVQLLKYVTYYPHHSELTPPVIFGYRFSQYENEYEVGFSQKDFVEAIKPIFLSLIVQSTISITLIFLISVLLLNINIIQPIHNLIQGLKIAEDGDYETRLPIFANDEIGFLTSTFNDFLYTIHIAHLSLKQANLDLEARVEQRTAELEIIRLVTETLNEEINLNDAIKAGLEMTMSLMNAASGWVFLLDSYQKPYLAAAFSLASEQFIQNTLLNTNEQHCSCLEKLYSGDFPKPEMINHCIYQPQSHIAIYLHHGKTPLGVLNLCLPKNYEFNDNDSNVLNTIGEALSAAIIRAQLYESEKQQRSIAETLQDTAIAFSSTLNIEEVLDQILEQTARLIPYDSANVMLIEDNRAYITRIKGYEKFGEKTKQITQLMSFDIEKTHNLKTVYETKQPLIVHDTRNDPHWIPFEGTEHIRSWLGAPLLSHNKVLGILCLDKIEPYFYTKEHEHLIKTIAIQAGLGLENATLYSNSLKDLLKEQQLHNISRTISNTFDLERALHKVISLIIELFNADDGFIGILESNHYPAKISQYYYPSKSNIAKDEELLKIIQAEILEKVVVLKKATIINNPLKINLPNNSSNPIQSLISAPLISGEISLGLIYIHHTHPQKRFYQRDKNLLESLGRQVGTALENARLFEEVQKLARTDSLTGINNRSSLFHLGMQEIDRAIRYQNALSLLMIDIDHFKRVNDTYGHTAGDQVLQSVAKKFIELCRKVDILGRYGGEEFVIILPETGLEEAIVVAERLRENIALMETIVDKRQKIKITISVGVTTLASQNMERKYTTDIFENLLEQADQALYKAKKDGRNCVRVYTLDELSKHFNGE